MKKLLVVVFIALLSVVGIAVKESAAFDPNICWRLDTFNTDTVRAFIRFFDIDGKKLVTAQYGYVVCPDNSGCTSHPGRVLLSGDFQKGVNGNKEMALSGSTFDTTFNSPFAFHCWFHMSFNADDLQTGSIAGDCENYPDFGPFGDTFSKVDCSTAP